MKPQSDLRQWAKPWAWVFWIFIGLGGVLLGQATSPSEEEFRTFTDTQGRTIDARILTVNDDQVQIERNDRQRFTLPVAMFTERDRAFIEAWAKSNALKAQTAFTLGATAKFENDRRSEPMGLFRRERDAYYEIKLENMTSEPLKGLELRYRIYVRDTDASATRDRRSDRWEERVVRNIELEPRKEYTHDTVRMRLVETRLKPGWKWASGAPATSRDALRGLFFRVYYKGEVIQEYSRPDTFWREMDEAQRKFFE